MSAISRAGAAATPAAGRPPEDPKLRKAAQQLQGVFVQELFKAMRTTVPQGEGFVDGGSGEEMFTGLMDQHLAVETPQAWGRGLGEAIYQHMRDRVGKAAGGGAPAAADPGHPIAPSPLAPTLPMLPMPTEPVVPLPDAHALLSPLRDAGR